jgi:hypothetical protein
MPATELSPDAKARLAHRLASAARDAFAGGDWQSAARGFGEAIEMAPQAAANDELRLVLAVIHVRKLPDRARAIAHLGAIGAGLPESLRPLAEALRAEAEAMDVGASASAPPSADGARP